MKAIIDLLSGKKMYLIGFVVVLVGVMEGVMGFDIPGVDVGGDWLAWVLTGLGVGAAKAAIVKSAP